MKIRLPLSTAMTVSSRSRYSCVISAASSSSRRRMVCSWIRMRSRSSCIGRMGHTLGMDFTRVIQGGRSAALISVVRLDRR